MTIETAALLVSIRALYQEIDLATAQYAARFGIRCVHGCGRCCLQPQLMVSVTDCLALADGLLAEGLAEAYLSFLQESEGQDEGVCPLYQATRAGRGHCQRYADRPSLCRLFGYAAARGKDGSLRPIICRSMQDELGIKKELLQQRLAHVTADGQGMPPIVGEMSARLAALDPAHGYQLLPIRQALREALTHRLWAKHYDRP